MCIPFNPSANAKITSGQVVTFKAGLTYPIPSPIRFAGSGIRFVKEGAGADPRLRFSAGGFQATGPVKDVTWDQLSIENAGTAALDKGGLTGISVIQRASGLLIASTAVIGFEWNVSITHPKSDAGILPDPVPRGEWITAVRLINARLLDARSPKLYGGQGLYCKHVDGLTIDGGIFDGNGWDGKVTTKASIYRHGAYIGFPTANVKVRNLIVSRNALYGLQCRGGADIDGLLAYDNATGVLVNGPTSSVRNSVFVAGHFTDWKAGRGGVEWSCNKGTLANNVYIPAAAPAPSGYAVQQPWWFQTRKTTAMAWEQQGVKNWTASGNVVAKRSAMLTQAEIDSARSGRTSAAQLMASVKGQAGI